MSVKNEELKAEDQVQGQEAPDDQAQPENVASDEPEMQPIIDLAQPEVQPGVVQSVDDVRLAQLEKLCEGHEGRIRRLEMLVQQIKAGQL